MSYAPYPSYPAGSAGKVQTVIVQERIRPASTAHIVIAWVLAGLTGLYGLPWAIAATRHHQNVVAIAVINFFLGWTVVGWLGMLIWACLGVHTRPVVTSAAVFGGYGYPQPLPASSPSHHQEWTQPPALAPGNAGLAPLADQTSTLPYQTLASQTPPPSQTLPSQTWPQYTRQQYRQHD